MTNHQPSDKNLLEAQKMLDDDVLMHDVGVPGPMLSERIARVLDGRDRRIDWLTRDLGNSNMVRVLIEQIADMNGLDCLMERLKGLPVSKFNGPLRKAIEESLALTEEALSDE